MTAMTPAPAAAGRRGPRPGPAGTTPRPYGATALALAALILIGMGLYFVFWRPPLLPEDARYVGASPDDLLVAAPGLLRWLRRVFWVLGGYILSTGVLTLYLARTAFRPRAGSRPQAASVVALAGLTSIGWMAAVNFLIDSDFKWLLLGVALLWAGAATLLWSGK